jgi:sugar phosphate isomerase/epimerase
MQLGIFAKTFPRPTLEETLDAVASHPLTQVQFNMSCAGLPTLPDRIDEDFCVWIARLVKERGLTMAAISGTFNLCDPDAARLEDNLRRLGVLAAACRWLDTRIITLCSGTLDPEDMWKWHPDNVRRSTWETLVGSVRAAIKIADHHEVTLAFEPEIHNVVNSVSKARRLLDEIDSRWLKIVIDPANLFRPGERSRITEILDEAFDWLGRDIVLAHAKDPRFDKVGDDAVAAREFFDFAERNTSFMLVAAREFLDFARRLTHFKHVMWNMPRKERRPDEFPELPESLMRRFFYFWGFYQRYISWLKRIEYTGAVVMHGLDESEVHVNTVFLQRVNQWSSAER